MAKKPATAGDAAALTSMDYAEQERTYRGFVELIKLSVIGMALLMIGLYFVVIGGQPVLGGILIFASIIVPPLMAVFQRKG
ncbi:aa3-type cytochrome c oxidase subunit IV [Paradevosia shaoguanensis]|jgi:hypothetical protein|uniref:Aa3-type cytochrome c oxidase subunit IV n=1 Tax=Paradevosia shaoguanensis TaxID=1335043 RepID=A0AA41QQJ1_9HYPH|nr:aa3-type cytochrome c oxidase subunit IV [Paradevosia shaoguanensis]KFL26079.1 hypothetical protein JP74_15165 [Devosia sp. 17-2-E-8]MBI4048224.1 aa3-type cytochrome c oxidase subunit IV [Devosia nanyangense]QMV00745.1 aa3-type cytochrome c oxidase subunit IV [Devosia sp. D6-9]CDP52889.1 hypothetical protein [Devosia sp. DBB001]MCF1744476.1 aa3-type cytochrome c oxidase subunit IV [Paradevosia shaoguanensis]